MLWLLVRSGVKCVFRTCSNVINFDLAGLYFDICVDQIHTGQIGQLVCYVFDLFEYIKCMV